MNWASRIHKLLGSFWSRLFNDDNFILAVENIHALSGKLIQGSIRNFISSMTIAERNTARSRQPIEILLDKASAHRPYSTAEDILASGAEASVIGRESDSDTRLVFHTSVDLSGIRYLTNSVSNASVTLIRDLDFRVYGDSILMHRDPAELGFALHKRTANGTLSVIYKAYGIYEGTPYKNSPVAGFISPELTGCADVAWDIHVNGATEYNTKQLLSYAADAVICEEDGKVADIWEEQGYTHIWIGNRVYSHTGPSNIPHGTADVKKGTVLFGELSLYSGENWPDTTEVPGIKVRTDVGVLTAENADKQPYVLPSGELALPLTGNDAQVEAYKERVADLYADTNCPVASLGSGSSINPMRYITNEVRKGNSSIVTLRASCMDVLPAAVELLRKGSNVSGMFNIIVKADTDSCGLDIREHSSRAGNAAVSVEVVTITNGAEATAKVFI